MMMERVFLGLLLCLAVYLFWTQKLRNDLTAVLVMLALVLPWPHGGGEWRAILTPGEGFSGFGSTAVIMVTAMFIFGGALVKTGAVEFIGARLFRSASRSEWLFQAAVLGLSTLLSMFVNDTTVVLVLLPMILTVCREQKLSPSRYLMACAYGSLLGGQWTLIGTRSNLLISDYLRQHTDQPLGFFDLTPIGAAVFALSALYFLTVGRRILPREAPSGQEEGDREYLTEAVVQPGSTGVNRMIDELGWSKRDDVEVVEVLRGTRRMSHQERLRPGDRIILRGPTAAMGELLKTPDFQLKGEIGMDPETLQRIDLVTAEVMLAAHSGYAGSTLQNLWFIHTFGFSVLGVSRRGRTIRKWPETDRLEVGDSLLLLGPSDRVAWLQRNPNLIVLGEQSFPAIGKRKALIMVALLASVIGLAISGLLNPSISIPVAAFLAIVLGCIRPQDAYQSVDWPAVVTVAGMIPFGLALEKTHTTADLARWVVDLFAGWGPVAVLAAVLLLALVLTQVIENAAVAIIFAPLAYSVAEGMGVSPKTFLVALAVCVSAGFCTPFAHESTILVMGPGKYRFKHYLQIGTVLALLTWLVGAFLTPLVWPLRPGAQQMKRAN